MSSEILSIYHPGKTELEQFVTQVIDYSSQYGSEASISYTASNIVGRPTVFPGYGDCTEAFLLRQYGPWWSNNSSVPKSFQCPHPKDQPVPSDDFIEVKFQEKVYPLRFDFYETYNPGAVISIFAYSYGDESWKRIWTEIPKVEMAESRKFSVYVKDVSFPTDLYHLEFYHQHLNYHYQLDAILLTGKSSQFFFQYMLQSNSLEKSEESEPKRNYPLTVCRKINGKILPNGYFDLLPDEVFHIILSYLDLQSLCRCARVSRLFQTHCYEPILYTGVDLKPYWYKVTSYTLECLQSRLSALQYLNLSWCGNQGRISPDSFIRFIEYCGKNIKYLHLSNCSFVNNDCMKAMADCCTRLQELKLCGCRQSNLDQLGFNQISRFTELCYLDLYRTLVDKQAVVAIIRSCSKLQHLLLGSCSSIVNHDDIATEIVRNARNFTSIDLWRAKTLTSAGVYLIASQGRYLVEIDLGWCLSIDASSGCLRELFHRCSNLKKVFLTAVRTLSDNDLAAIATYLKHLEQLDLLGTREISKEGVQRILNECKVLKLLDVSFCGQIDPITVDVWKKHFPNIVIQRSTQVPNPAYII